ncbi:MAG: Ni/Fe hydrogenase subunit alpha [Planctomycetaceae bacterium]|nr:Ni/Fe hydrogenase subunit alpha [Planctomycetaceae bacterium]
MSEPELIRVPILTRVEGEGGLTIRLRGRTLEDVQLNIYEPPRLFESLLRGRPLEDVPDITARICGICPAAYQMSSVHALERALEISVTPTIRRLRRLLYCGEWIESHSLHMHLLQAPDFFALHSGMELAQHAPQEVKRGLQLKKHGNRLLEVLGGRAIHPINVAVGGFHRLPRRDELADLIPDFEWGLQAAVEATRWVAGFSFPEFTGDYEFVAVTHPEEYPMNELHLRSSTIGDIPLDDWRQHFQEEHVAHSTALHAVQLPNRSSYFLGPLARVNLQRQQLAPTARRLADEIGFESPCRNPHRGIIARGLEVVHAYEEALSILRDYHPKGPARLPYAPRAGIGAAATEAPRGTLYHRYEIDDEGRVVTAQIVAPTSQNQRQIEADLRSFLKDRLTQVTARDQLGRESEQLVRTYDPCISCSTHFLKIRWEEA